RFLERVAEAQRQRGPSAAQRQLRAVHRALGVRRVQRVTVLTDAQAAANEVREFLAEAGQRRACSRTDERADADLVRLAALERQRRVALPADVRAQRVTHRGVEEIAEVGRL